MTVTDIDRIAAVQNKLFEVKEWVDETLKILNYVRIDKEHEAYTQRASSNATYPGQYPPKVEEEISADFKGGLEGCDT